MPLGGIVMGLVGLDLSWAIGHAARGADVTPLAFATSAGGFRMLADFFVFAFGGGLFVVPSFAAVADISFTTHHFVAFININFST